MRRCAAGPVPGRGPDADRPVKSEGVVDLEHVDPHPFMDKLNKHGLPWKVQDLDPPLDF